MAQLPSRNGRTVAGKKEVKALTTGAPVTTYTAGSAPPVTGTQTIANSATPTVVELLKYCRELHARIDAIVVALQA